GGSHDETEGDTNGSKSPPKKKSQGSTKETPAAKQRAESSGEGAPAGQSSLRGMALSVLEAAVEGLKNPQDSQAKAGTEEDGGAERSHNEEDDEEDEEDEDSDSTPHGERSEADDSSPRGSAEQTGEDDDDDEDEPSASAG